ncbi:hypothetical protein [Caproiciproducens sp.]
MAEIIENTENKTNENNEDSITMSKDEFTKKIQSETDKVRTEYSKQKKGLEDQISSLTDKIKELTPKEKTDAEKDVETRLHELEEKSKQADVEKKHYEFLNTLQSKNIPSSLHEYLKDDIDVEKFASVLTDIAKQSKINNGFEPVTHNSNTGVTKEQFNKMSYVEKAKLYSENPELYKTLIK